MNPRLGFRPRILAGAILVLASAVPVSAQVDPLLFIKKDPKCTVPAIAAETALPNVVFVVDTSHRMQRSAPTNPATVATSLATSHYYDPFIYPKNAANPVWQTSIGVTNANTANFYRRRYNNLEFANPLLGLGDRFTASTIQTAGDRYSAVRPVRGADAAVGRACRAVPGRRGEQDGRALRYREDASDDSDPGPSGTCVPCGGRRRHPATE